MALRLLGAHQVGVQIRLIGRVVTYGCSEGRRVTSSWVACAGGALGVLGGLHWLSYRASSVRSLSSWAYVLVVAAMADRRRERGHRSKCVIMPARHPAMVRRAYRAAVPGGWSPQPGRATAGMRR